MGSGKVKLFGDFFYLTTAVISCELKLVGENLQGKKKKENSAC